MTPSSTQCDHAKLQHLLQDSLSESQEERLAEHLNECEKCRHALEELAAETDDWSRIGNALKSETTGQSISASEPRSTLIPPELSKIENLHSVGVEIETSDFAVDFLKPCPNSDALGMLNDIEIRSIIGHGGNGIVLKGFQEELNRLVAVKVMAPQLATSAAARKRFSREAQATAAIVHPNVMPVLTVHSAGQLPYLVMPYVDCESLQERLDREGQLAALDVLRIAHQVANGLAAAHAQGLVHRDVKPANILLEKGVDRVMLTDFGLARAVDDGTLTRTGVIAGTPQYMSPEQARGDSVDTRSDLFSLGSVMYAMCTGRAPFRAETTYGILRRVTDEEPRAIGEVSSDIPKWLSGLISKLLAKNAADRFRDSSHIALLLEGCVAHVQQPTSNLLPAEVSVMSGYGRSAEVRRRWIRTLTHNPIAAVVSVLLILAMTIWINGAVWTSPSVPETEHVRAEVSAPDAEEQADNSIDGTTQDTSWNSTLTDDLKEINSDLDKLVQSLE